MTREELLEPVLDGLNAFSPGVFKDWEVVPGFIDGEHAATAILKGTEIHFAVVPKFRKAAILRGRAQEFLAPLLARQGFLTTRVHRTHKDKQKFVERMGFKPTWQDEISHYYLLGELPFARR